MRKLQIYYFCFFFSSRRRHTSLVSDWSSDVCSSDLVPTYQTNYKKMKKGKVTKRILDDEAIDKCMSAFETTDWSILKSDDLDEHIQNVTDYYINFVTTTYATEKQFYTKNN